MNTQTDEMIATLTQRATAAERRVVELERDAERRQREQDDLHEAHDIIDSIGRTYADEMLAHRRLEVQRVWQCWQALVRTAWLRREFIAMGDHLLKAGSRVHELELQRDAALARIRELEAEVAKRDDDAESWRETVRALNEAAGVEAIDAPSVPFHVQQPSSCTVQDTAAPSTHLGGVRGSVGGSGDSTDGDGYACVVKDCCEPPACKVGNGMWFCEKHAAEEHVEPFSKAEEYTQPASRFGRPWNRKLAMFGPDADASDPLAPRTYGNAEFTLDEVLTAKHAYQRFPLDAVEDLARHVCDLSDAVRISRASGAARAEELDAERAAHEQTRAELQRLRDGVLREVNGMDGTHSPAMECVVLRLRALLGGGHE